MTFKQAILTIIALALSGGLGYWKGWSDALELAKPKRKPRKPRAKKPALGKSLSIPQAAPEAPAEAAQKSEA